MSTSLEERIVPPTAFYIKRAAASLKEGKLVAFPTETVYGLGADATNTQAVQSVFDIKQRLSTKALPVHVPDRKTAEQFAIFNDKARKLADLFWPGPLTLVLPLKKNAPLSPLIYGTLNTIALRVSSHPVAKELLKQAGTPLVMSSANKSGSGSLLTAKKVSQEIGKHVAFILETSEYSTFKCDSTILDLTGEKALLLRKGALPPSEIEDSSGITVL